MKPPRRALRARATTLLVACSLLVSLGPAAASRATAPPLTVTVLSHLRAGHLTVGVPKVPVEVRGKLSSTGGGDRVELRVYKSSRRVARESKLVVGPAGAVERFAFVFRPKGRGAYRLHVQQLAASGQPVGTAKARLYVVRPHAGQGSHGRAVRALQQRLAVLGYLTKVNGVYGDGTARAVLAFRKVNGYARTFSANRAVFKKLAKGKGGFRVRYPRAGRHVEFDWSRQITVLAQGARPMMILHTSSGAPGTPTAFGKFHFWLKQAGYNQKQMYYSVYFHNGQAIHGFASVPNYPASHGCLRISISNAIRVYNWIHLGDPIYVYR